jgi:hypothetical protein
MNEKLNNLRQNIDFLNCYKLHCRAITITIITISSSFEYYVPPKKQRTIFPEIEYYRGQVPWDTSFFRPQVLLLSLLAFCLLWRGVGHHEQEDDENLFHKVVFY